MALIKIAVLDDYQGFSKQHYDRLPTDRFEIAYIKDTLLPYNHENTPVSVKDKLVERLKPFEIISTMRERTPFPAELVHRLPNLKLLLTTGPRNAALDLAAFKERQIPVAGTVHGSSSSAKKTGVDSTTQHCIALIMALARGIAQDDLAVKTGGWQSGPAIGLAGKTLGVVGLGRLGVNVAKIMHIAFGMRVIAWSTNLTQEAADESAKNAGLPISDSDNQKTFKVVSRDELFSTADVISIHLVLSERSKGIIGANDLSKMQPSSLLINTSRGPLVVEKDLLDVVKAGGIQGVALDVFDIEPLPADSEWRSTEWGKNGTSQVLLTPHMGYVEEPALSDWYKQQVDNIERWESGEALYGILA